MPRIITCLLILSFTATPAYAYVGPGLGFGAIASFLALIAAIFLTVFGFLWLPLKRLWQLRKSGEKHADNSPENEDHKEVVQQHSPPDENAETIKGNTQDNTVEMK